MHAYGRTRAHVLSNAARNARITRSDRNENNKNTNYLPTQRTARGWGRVEIRFLFQWNCKRAARAHAWVGQTAAETGDRGAHAAPLRAHA
eukprot:3568141-Lingulodinium_polyedra.AAC.2